MAVRAIEKGSSQIRDNWLVASDVVQGLLRIDGIPRDLPST